MKTDRVPPRCDKPHPHLKFDNGLKVRCTKPRGHHRNGDYDHFDSFAMRSWDSA